MAGHADFSRYDVRVAIKFHVAGGKKTVRKWVREFEGGRDSAEAKSVLEGQERPRLMKMCSVSRSPWLRTAGEHVILEQGMQTEPGKLNEISYQPVKFVRENSPKHPCISADASRRRQFSDFGATYDYEMELCLNSKVQAAYLRTCSCQYVELPRMSEPNSSHPFCGRIDGKTAERIRCCKGIDQRRIRQSFESDCLPRCVDTSYSKELSVTKWRNTRWMLYWIKEVSNRWNSHFRNMKTLNSTPEQFEKDLRSVEEYLRMPNITDSRVLGRRNDSLEFNDRFTYVVVKRQSNNTLVKQEKIVLTLNALFSRIGGLCSMYIGLTLAFFVECIELVYKIVFSDPNGRGKSPNQVLDVTENSDNVDLLDVSNSSWKPRHTPDEQQEFVWLPRTNTSSNL